MLSADAPLFSVVTTSLMPNGDCIEVVIYKKGEKWIIKDSALSYQFLFSNGIDLSLSQEKSHLDRAQGIAKRYGSDLVNFEVVKEVGESDLWIGTTLLVQAVQEICSLINEMRASVQYNFQEKVFAFFAARGAKVDRNYKIKGNTKSNKFDLRLNGGNEILLRTISTRSSSQVQLLIERSWFAFEDVARTGRSFERAIILDDSEPEREDALRQDHLSTLAKIDVPAYRFEVDKERLEAMARSHSS